MMKKFGVNNTKMEKKVAGDSGPVTSIVFCSQCGRKFEKSCPSERLCKISNTKCPHCGGKLEA
jgi:hypothetical protein